MKRGTKLAALLLTTAAIALFLNARQPTIVEEVEQEDERKAQEVKPSSSESNEWKEPLLTSDVPQSAMPESVLTARYVDEETSRRLAKEHATTETRRYYSLLLEHLGLTQPEQKALMSVLIEDQLLRTTTPYVRGGPTEPQQRARKISAIIGEPKLTQFLSLERHVAAYGEIYNIGIMLEHNGAPLAAQQREKLLDLLITTRDQSEVKPFPESERTSMKYLEQRIAERDEYDRHVLELSVSALSPKQVQHLFDHFQSRSQERARAVEFNMKLRADDPTVSFVLSPE